MKLTELLKSHYPFVLQDGDMGDYGAVFKTSDGSTVELQYTYWPGPALFEIEFTRDGEWGVTSGGDALKIFGTVVAATEALLKEENPAGFVFSSKNSEMSRIFLYERLVKRLTADGRFVDASHRLNELKNKTTRIWFSNKRFAAKDNTWKLIVRADELGEPVQESEKGKANVKYEVTHETASNFSTTTDIFGRRFDFEALLEQHEDGEVWDIAFGEIDADSDAPKYGLTGSSLGFRVSSFVGASLKELIARHAPQRISFSIEHEAGERGRTRLYDRLLKNNGYELSADQGRIKMYSPK